MARPGFPARVLYFPSGVISSHLTASEAAAALAQVLGGDDATAAMVVSVISADKPLSAITVRLLRGRSPRAVVDASGGGSVGVARFPEGGFAVLVGSLGEASPDEAEIDKFVAQLSAEGGRWVTVRLARENCHVVTA